MLSKRINTHKRSTDLISSPLPPYSCFNAPGNITTALSCLQGFYSSNLHDMCPHLFQVLFEYSLLSKVLPNDHLIYNHTPPPNPRLLVLLCYSLLQ